MFLPKGAPTNFGNFTRPNYWWRHTEDENNLVVAWLAKTMVGFREVLRQTLAQIKLTVVKREDVLIISDLMLPCVDGNPEMPNGVSVVLAAISEDIIAAVCTDTNHHDAQFFQDLHPLLSEKAAYDIPYCMDAKDWDSAISGVLKVQEKFGNLQ